jgi:hypothetical protein
VDWQHSQARTAQTFTHSGNARVTTARNRRKVFALRPSTLSRMQKCDGSLEAQSPPFFLGSWRDQHRERIVYPM